MKTANDCVHSLSRLALLFLLFLACSCQCASESPPSGLRECQYKRPLCSSYSCIGFNSNVPECVYRAEGSASCPCYLGEVKLCPDDSVRRCIQSSTTSTMWDRTCP